MNQPANPQPLSGPDAIAHSPVTRELAQRAMRLALPSLEYAVSDPFFGDSGFLHVVIMDPAKGPLQSSFEEAILHEHSVGDRVRWDADYGAFARAKARVSWRTGCDSHLVQLLRPQLLVAGDTTLWGGVALDGIVVAASGALPQFDEALAGIVAMCIRGLAKDIRETPAARLSLP